MVKNEFDRLLYGIDMTQKLDSGFLINFEVICEGNSAVVLERCKEVLISVLQNNAEKLYSLEDWRTKLPEWFISFCAEEITKEEAERRIQLSLEERQRIAIEEGWSLSSWLYWFYPEQRHWYWWDAKILNRDTFTIIVKCDSWPFPYGALKWLVAASGARYIEEVE